MQLKDIMSKNPEVISPETTLRQAAEQMKEQDVGFLPIGEDDSLTGAITDRDIIIRGLAEGKDAEKTTVKDIMTDEIRYCFENDDIEKAAKMMGDLQIRRLAILNEDKRLVGIVSLGDIATKSHDADLTGKVTTQISEN